MSKKDSEVLLSQKPLVKKIQIGSHEEGQRVDNYLLKYCKGVPKTRLYRALRKGEVRVNQKRVKADYRLLADDELRIPPLRDGIAAAPQKTSSSLLEDIAACIMQENDDYLIVNKPSGIPVHGGTGIKTGLIEALRELRPQCKLLELAHRIDRETSGCLVIAKKRAFLLDFHQRLLHKEVKKSYVALVQGNWLDGEQKVTAPLQKNHLSSGERIVVVSEMGKPATTIFRPLQRFCGATLVEALPLTGRTHQIRVHATHSGHPIAGDVKYGDRDFNKYLHKKGLDRLFLHASSVYCQLSDSPARYLGLCAPLPDALKALLMVLV